MSVVSVSAPGGGKGAGTDPLRVQGDACIARGHLNTKRHDLAKAEYLSLNPLVLISLIKV